LPDKAIRMADQ